MDSSINKPAEKVQGSPEAKRAGEEAEREAPKKSRVVKISTRKGTPSRTDHPKPSMASITSPTTSLASTASPASTATSQPPGQDQGPDSAVVAQRHAIYKTYNWQHKLYQNQIEDIYKSVGKAWGKMPPSTLREAISRLGIELEVNPHLVAPALSHEVKTIAYLAAKSHPDNFVTINTYLDIIGHS